MNRISIGENELKHLLLGGTLAAADVEISLQDIGYDTIDEMFYDIETEDGRFGESLAVMAKWNQ